jgi:hypothetical protein
MVCWGLESEKLDVKENGMEHGIYGNGIEDRDRYKIGPKQNRNESTAKESEQVRIIVASLSMSQYRYKVEWSQFHLAYACSIK